MNKNFLIIIVLLSTNVLAERRNIRKSGVNTQNQVRNVSINSTGLENKENIKVNSEDKLQKVASTYPESGDYFKTNNFVFTEGKRYKLSDFVKSTEKGILIFTSSCGMNLNAFYENQYGNISAVQNYGSLKANHIPIDNVISGKKEHLDNSSIVFTEGSAKACNGTNVFLFKSDDLLDGLKDKMSYSIIEANDNNDDKVMVSKSTYSDVKNNCANIDMKTLNDVKNLLLASSISSGVSTASGLAGTGIGIASIVNDGKKNDSDLNKKLDVAQTITSGISAASSGVSTTTSVIAIQKVKDLMKQIESCRDSAKSL